MFRLWSAFAAIVLTYSLVIARLFYWQVIAGSDLRAEASSQYYLQLPLPSQRGTIVASDGKPLVMNEPAFLVYAEPQTITDRNAFVAAVAPLMELDPDELGKQLSERNRAWVPLGHKVDNTKTNALKALGLKGIGFEKEPKRYYPEASAAAHLLGFVGSDEFGRDIGYFGLEGYYDRELGGKDGRLQLEKDVRGAPILINQPLRIEPENGRTLELWLDRTVQRIVEQRLSEGITKYGAKEGSVIVMDPKTGGILAMASFPSYDPAKFTQFDRDLYKNPTVAASFEPGSTFKALVMAASLNEKKLTPITTMDENGPVTIGEYTIRTWNSQYHGQITMSQVLQYSSNTGMVYVGRQLGKDAFLTYIKAFGFGTPTNIDLQEEFSPEIRESSEWSEIDLATTSFGQGIAVTPLQMVRAVGALANGGALMEPHVVRAIIDAKGNRAEMKPKKVRDVISKAAANVIAEMLINAVDNGEAKWAKPPGYRIAGKTGTAQIPVSGHYDEEKTIASFVGFAPADDPKFVMLVTLREPTSSPWGSETAAPLFFTIARDLFSYWSIPPQ